MKRFGLASFFLAAGLLLAPGAHAQHGKINGRVTDSQGAVLPGATVVATRVHTGIQPPS